MEENLNILENYKFLFIFILFFEVLARVYFSITRKSIDKVGEGKKRETFPVPHTGNGSKDSLLF
jgi:hypothetical protein